MAGYPSSPLIRAIPPSLQYGRAAAAARYSIIPLATLHPHILFSDVCSAARGTTARACLFLAWDCTNAPSKIVRPSRSHPGCCIVASQRKPFWAWRRFNLPSVHIAGWLGMRCVRPLIVNLEHTERCMQATDHRVLYSSQILPQMSSSITKWDHRIYQNTMPCLLYFSSTSVPPKGISSDLKYCTFVCPASSKERHAPNQRRS